MITFIVDASVVFHLIHSKMQQFALSHENKRLYIQASFLWINALGMMPYFTNADGCRIIWALDKKPYWRSQFCTEYKGNRVKKYDLDFVFQVFGELDLLSIGIQGYEADDIAALFCVLFRRRPLRSDWQQIYLLTVDTDWQGLIGDGITWVDIGNHEPCVRDVPIVYEWFKNRHGKQSKKWQKLYDLPSFEEFHPTNIWDWKVAVGDKSDNLDPGCDAHLINLYEPHPDYCLWSNVDAVTAANELLKKQIDLTYSAKEMTTVLNGLGLSMPLSYIVL